MTNLTRDLEVYLVGGAVRDQLLGVEVKDRDWVVVGSTPQQMIDMGFLPVGKDFPVFLHPHSKEEYALARTERKIAPGYRGFKISSDPTITLEEDLKRRDLTINAIAMTEDKRIIDPYGGVSDIEQRLLRHVSEAFREDPLRILRVARFATRYAELNFYVDEQTLSLMRDMVDGGEADSLVAERVWQELEAVLAMPAPSTFFKVLQECGAMRIILPEINALFGIPQPKQHHPEVDSGIHTMLSLDIAAGKHGDQLSAFAALVHDLGKTLTPKDLWPSHHGHEKAGLDLISSFCNRLRVPARYKKVALHVCEYHLKMHQIQQLRPGSVLRILYGLDAFRQPDNIATFIRACEADYRGRYGMQDKDYPQSSWLRAYVEATNTLKPSAEALISQDDRKIKDSLEKAQLDAITATKRHLVCALT